MLPTSESAPVQIRGKLGTHPTAVYLVHGCDMPLVAGDRVFVRSDMDGRASKWIEVYVHEIRDVHGDFFFLGFV